MSVFESESSCEGAVHRLTDRLCQDSDGADDAARAVGYVIDVIDLAIKQVGRLGAVASNRAALERAVLRLEFGDLDVAISAARDAVVTRDLGRGRDTSFACRQNPALVPLESDESFTALSHRKMRDGAGRHLLCPTPIDAREDVLVVDPDPSSRNGSLVELDRPQPDELRGDVSRPGPTQGNRFMSDSDLTFRYRLEQQPPRVGAGGVTRGASVRQFPASRGIAGVSMRLDPGSMRELHWHANAAEWAYVVSGCCRTTILHPQGGSATDTFGPGDVWYFPRGWGHSIQGIGPGPCHFILIFDNGDFSEDHTFSVTDWLSRTPAEVAAQNLGLDPTEVARLPKGEAYFAHGPVPDDRSADAAVRSRPTLVTAHRYPLHAQQPRRVPGGGTQRTVTVDEFPLSTTMSGSVLEIEPGAMRGLHWHPNADEWQYYLEGTGEMGVFLAQGQVVTDRFEAGDVGYAPMGSGHYIRNTGPGVLRVLIGFNSGQYLANDLSAWLASNPSDVLATNLGLSRAVVDGMPRREGFMVPSASRYDD